MHMCIYHFLFFTSCCFTLYTWMLSIIACVHLLCSFGILHRIWWYGLNLIYLTSPPEWVFRLILVSFGISSNAVMNVYLHMPLWTKDLFVGQVLEVKFLDTFIILIHITKLPSKEFVSVVASKI